MNIYLAQLNFILGIIYIGIALYALHSNRKSFLNISFSLLSLSFGVGAFAYYIFFLTSTLTTAMIAYKISGVSFYWITSFMLMFFINYAEVKFKRPKIIYTLISLIPVTFISIMLFSEQITLTYQSFKPTSIGWIPITNKSSIVPYIYALYHFSSSFIFLFLVYKMNKNAKSYTQKKQTGLIFWGAIFAWFLTTGLHFGVPLLGIELPPLSTFSVGIFSIIIWYAIANYKIMTPTFVAASREILETMDDSVLLIDPDMAIVEFNKAANQIFGLDQDKAKKKLSDFIIDHHGNKSIIEDIQDKRTIRYKDCKLINKDNHEIKAILSAGYINNRYQDLIGILIVLTDVTAQKDAEEKIKQLNNNLLEHKKNLEEIVKDRTHELSEANNQLRATLKDLKDSQQIIIKNEKLASLGTMIAGIAHEINNPAQAIKFSLEGLALNIRDVEYLIHEILEIKELKPAEIIGKFDKIKQMIDLLDLTTLMTEIQNFIRDNLKSVDRIEHIIKSSKNMAHAESSASLCSINEIIEDALILVHNQLKYCLTVHKELSPEIPHTRLMAQELGQVFINLLTNAKDAIEEKGLDVNSGIITIKTTYCPDHQQIIIEFSDNGIGVKPENSLKIFDPFFTTKPIGKGTGLGLSLTYKIIEAHKGNIEMDSAPQIGTKFIIRLPLRTKL